MSPIWEAPEEGQAALREFAERCLRDAASAPPVREPRDVKFEASMPNGSEVADQMLDAGWTRSGEVEYSAQLSTWLDRGSCWRPR